MYDLKRDPLELTNLAHATHSTPASDLERARLHQRLTEVMRINGTTARRDSLAGRRRVHAHQPGLPWPAKTKRLRNWKRRTLMMRIMSTR